MLHLLKYFLYGWLILFLAILFNLVAGALGITTWYEYLGRVGDSGLRTATHSLQLIDFLFLFLLYPGLFGLILYLLKP